MRTLTLLALTALLAGCSSAPKKTGSPMQGYADAASIKAEVSALLTAAKFDDVSKLKVEKRLEELLAQDEIKLRIDAARCSGAGIFSIGGGGLLVRVSKGHGLVSFAGGSRQRRFDENSFLVGAVAGGGKSFGAFLVFELAQEKDLEGDYRVKATGGSFGETSFSAAKLTPSRKGMKHYVHAVGTGAGFGAEAGWGKASIRLVDPKQAPGEAPASKPAKE